MKSPNHSWLIKGLGIVFIIGFAGILMGTQGFGNQTLVPEVQAANNVYDCDRDYRDCKNEAREDYHICRVRCGYLHQAAHALNYCYNECKEIQEATFDACRLDYENCIEFLRGMVD